MEQLILAERHAAQTKVDFEPSSETDAYDIYYHRLEWDVDPAVRFISGTVTTYFRVRAAQMDSLYFDLDGQLNVSSTRFQGKEIPFVHDKVNHQLILLLPQPLIEGNLDSVAVTYAGEPNKSGFGSFERKEHNGVPIIWTLSEPYGSRDWWPGKMSLNDKIDSIDILVRTPAGNQVASLGLLVEETTEGGTTFFHWKHRYPVTNYLIAIAVTNYSVYSDWVPLEDGGQIQVQNFVYPEKLESTMDRTATIVEIMQLFIELFGPYPFEKEKYGHAEFGFPGGMEHQTMSFMWSSWSHLLFAHELAHHWFGNKITCGSWEDIWLNEGYASYCVGLTYENGLGNKTWAKWKTDEINKAAREPGGSVWVDDTTNVRRIFDGRLSYTKGGLLLHMIRWKIGDEAFFQATRNYLNDPLLAYGYARTPALIDHFEEQANTDLTEFMADWFFGEGYPSYQVFWEPNADGIKVRLEQTTSHPSVDFFEMPVPLLVSGEGFDSILVLDHTLSGQTFSVDLPFIPDAVAFDPDQWLLSKDNTVERVITNNPAEPRDELEITLFPVPANDVLQIQLPEAPIDLVWFDLAGRQMGQLRLNDLSISLAVADLPKGTYLFRFIGKDWTREKLVQKQ